MDAAPIGLSKSISSNTVSRCSKCRCYSKSDLITGAGNGGT